jgi:hypothetical protein
MINTLDSSVDAPNLALEDPRAYMPWIGST